MSTAGKGAVLKKGRKGGRPAGSPAKRRQSTVEEKAVEKIAALYWDLNCVAVFRQINIGGKPSPEDDANYDSMQQNTTLFINSAMRECSATFHDGVLPTRCVNFINELGWKIFGICAQSECFRVSTDKIDAANWLHFQKLISDNRRSIDVFARSRLVDWRGPLLTYTQYNLPGLNDALSPEINIAGEHPHHIVREIDDHLKRPICNGRAQVNMSSSRWNPDNFPKFPRRNPALRNPEMGVCLMCHSRENCGCRLTSMAGDLVELVEFSGRGTGVRALANFKKHDILGEYVGVLVPLGSELSDEIYALTTCAFDPATGKLENVCEIFPRKLGNWTRFLNHSCSPAANFIWGLVGDQVVTTIRAERNISIFEEITTDYGLLTQSYARGPSQPPLIESTVGDHFAKVVAEHGDRTAVISKHQNDRITYASLDTRSNALARGLESVGIKKGDRVGVMLGNSMEYAVITYALFKLGAILVPLNPSFNAMQIASALGHLESSHLIINTESNLPRKDPRNNIPLLQHLVEDLSSSKLGSCLVPSLKQIILLDNSAGRVDVSSYKSLTPFSSITSDLSADGQPLTERNLDPNDIVNIQFTSGTTAMPKAACLTHRSILNNGSQVGDRMLLTPEDIVCCPPPLFHCFGCTLGYMATATHGSAIVFPTESFNARAVLKAVQEEKCTALYGVPTMFLEELGLIESGEISKDGFQYLRTGIAAGSSIPSELMKKLHRVLNLTELTICYGMTETSPVSAMTHTDDPIDKRLNTVGRLMPHVEAKVVHPANRKEILPIGTRGELAVSGYLLMKGYWGDPERTAKEMFADDNGKLWMHTGDEASMSPDGYITITGRIKDLIIRGGENIHPLEIEDCLLAHPGVGEVSIVGVPDERYGEVVAAFVVAREPGSLTPEDIQQWVRGKLSSHLVPKYVFFLKASDASAKTASGKVQKFKLKEQAIKLLAERL
ncbi:uncharacterized protein N7503_011109 [Penicillium pulvis]|uniref:uncharacterized protein n=1 Tax=Penicillium pulvis TaxID=1562058 RepID=UPI002548CEAD|nr:uncharacterized protein N7503_011109 [Penicillium pulvis]KAJ5785897.1 hypothetical protein N7503_011109 [Penicillium pulvis]